MPSSLIELKATLPLQAFAAKRKLLRERGRAA